MSKYNSLLQQSIRNDFKIVDLGITVEKAMGIINNQKITTLIIEYPTDIYPTTYKIITSKEIANCIAMGIDPSKTKIESIAVAATVVDYFQYFSEIRKLISNSERIYLIRKKDKITGISTREDILELLRKNGISISNLKCTSNGTELEKFITSHEDPLAEIDKFYVIIASKGFTIDANLKKYFRNKIIDALETKLEYDTYSTAPEISEPIIPDDKESVPAKKHDTEGISRMAIMYHHNHIHHKSTVPSPENPDRISNIINLLKGNRVNIFKNYCKLISDFKPARPQDILRVHTRTYFDFVKAYSKKGGGFLGDSTYFTPYTYTTALLAAGGAIGAGNVVLKEGYEFSLALIRPPGHHATADKYGGYCIFNNSAVLARYLQRKRKLEKIMIIDWDAHSANGTQQIFYNDPTVLLVSIHQDPHGFYPNTGFTEQLGRGEGLGYNINIEMPKDSGDKEYMLVFKEIILPIFNSYTPDFIIGCNGFDAYYNDPYTKLKLTSNGYYYIGRTLGKIMKHKLTVLIEGGYHSYNGELTHTIINSLLGLPNPFKEQYDSLAASVTNSEKVRKILVDKIGLLKRLLAEYHTI